MEHYTTGEETSPLRRRLQLMGHYTTGEETSPLRRRLQLMGHYTTGEETSPLRWGASGRECYVHKTFPIYIINHIPICPASIPRSAPASTSVG